MSYLPPVGCVFVARQTQNIWWVRDVETMVSVVPRTPIIIKEGVGAWRDLSDMRGIDYTVIARDVPTLEAAQAVAALKGLGA